MKSVCVYILYMIYACTVFGNRLYVFDKKENKIYVMQYIYRYNM